MNQKYVLVLKTSMPCRISARIASLNGSPASDADTAWAERRSASRSNSNEACGYLAIDLANVTACPRAVANKRNVQNQLVVNLLNKCTRSGRHQPVRQTEFQRFLAAQHTTGQQQIQGARQANQ